MSEVPSTTSSVARGGAGGDSEVSEPASKRHAAAASHEEEAETKQSHEGDVEIVDGPLASLAVLVKSLDSAATTIEDAMNSNLLGRRERTITNFNAAYQVVFDFLLRKRSEFQAAHNYVNSIPVNPT